jgi:hypothetical protein
MAGIIVEIDPKKGFVQRKSGGNSVISRIGGGGGDTFTSTSELLYAGDGPHYLVANSNYVLSNVNQNRTYRIRISSDALSDFTFPDDTAILRVEFALGENDGSEENNETIYISAESNIGAEDLLNKFALAILDDEIGSQVFTDIDVYPGDGEMIMEISWDFEIYFDDSPDFYLYKNDFNTNIWSLNIDYDVNEEGVVDECIIYLPTAEVQTGDTINIFTFDNNQNDDLELRFRCEDDTAINNRKNAFRRFDCDGFADQFKCIYHSSVGWVVMQLSYVD